MIVPFAGRRDTQLGPPSARGQLYDDPDLVSRHEMGWRMAVLPFRCIGEPVGYGIALGMAEEVSAAISCFRAPRVIATATFWDGAGPAADALGQCRTYQLDYIVEGSIQVLEDRVQVDVTLSDVVLGFEVIWTERFDGSVDDLFLLQHRIARETIVRIDPELFEDASVFAPPAGTKIAGAHRAVLAAIQGIFRLDRQRFMRARDLLALAIELDPGYAAAHAWIAYWSIMAVGQGWVDEPADVTTLAGGSAERAMFLDPLDARALAIAGHVKAYLIHDVRSALELHARAIALSPNLPIAWTLSSWSKIYNGEHAAAVRHAKMSLSLSPRDPHIFFVEHALMTAYFFSHELEQAEMLAEVVLQRNPGHASALNVRLAILGHMGRKEEASHCLAMLREIDPNASIEKIVARPPLRPEDRSFYVEGLQRAGVPPRQILGLAPTNWST
jgi:TolB-like protein